MSWWRWTRPRRGCEKVDPPAAVPSPTLACVTRRWMDFRQDAWTKVLLACIPAAFGGGAMKRREFIAGIGAATAWPLAARAQQPKKIPTVGILWHAGSREEEGILYDSMHAGFAALGYVAGKNVVFEERFPGETPGRIESFPHELVGLNVDVLVAVGAPSILAAQKAATTIPVVFVPPQDPITHNVVASLARHGSNLPGLTTMGVEVAPKRVQLLKSTFPDISSIAMLFDPVVAYNVVREIEETRLAVNKLGMGFEAFEAHVWEHVEPIFAKIAQGHFNAVIVAQGPMFFIEPPRIAPLT